jgi:plasmid maintenance system killer protein
MDIYYRTRKLENVCNNKTKALKEYGQILARLLQRRLSELKAAETLADVRTLPGARCHELVWDRQGQLSVDLKHPRRLIFVPANDPIPKKEDGGLDWGNVTEVEIIEIEDTHSGKKK